MGLLIGDNANANRLSENWMRSYLRGADRDQPAFACGCLQIEPTTPLSANAPAVAGSTKGQAILPSLLFLWLCAVGRRERERNETRQRDGPAKPHQTRRVRPWILILLSLKFCTQCGTRRL